MTKFGQVNAFDEGTGIATIVYARPDACEKCGACGLKTAQGTILLKADCAVGDWVRVELPDALFLRATFLAYLVPLVLFLLGLAAGYFAGGKNELAAIAGAGIGLVLGLIAVWAAGLLIRRKPEWTPRVTAVYADKPSMDELGCGGGH